MFDIKENLKKLPDKPGVYLHKNSLDEIIYVGKAISLKNRVRQYFQSSKNMDNKVRAMVGNIESFEYIVCGTEMEALILENNLIKKHQPKYNILLRDDKTYPYIKITNEKWRRIEKTRRVETDGAKYYGPFTDVSSVNSIVDLLSQIYKLKKCAIRHFPKGYRPCLNYYIGQCGGICIGKEKVLEYGKRIDEVEKFLKGNTFDLIDFLEKKMYSLSEELKFEEAGRYRDYITDVKNLMEKQRVVLQNKIDMDIVLVGYNKEIVLFSVENGLLTSRETYYLDNLTDNEDEVLSAFLKQHYSKQQKGVREIIVDRNILDAQLIEEFLSNIWGKKVKIIREPKGEKKALLQLAKNDVVEMSALGKMRKESRLEKEKYIESIFEDIVKKTHRLKGIEALIDNETGEMVDLFDSNFRLEAYDVSNTNGVDNVGVMVVYQGLQKMKKSYRKFRLLLGSQKGDDYESMTQMIDRRIKRALAMDESFLPLPRVFLIDGGRGHISRVKEVVDKYGLDIAVIGMVKDDRHKSNKLVFIRDFLEGKANFEFVDIKNLKDRNMMYSYIGNIQEEVHRFAIDYHRNLRNTNTFTSELDNIKGIGIKKRESLLKHFKNIENIKSARQNELEAVENITKSNAESIVEYFKSQKRS